VTKKVRCAAIQLGKKGLEFETMAKAVLVLIVLGVLIVAMGRFFVPGYGEINKYQIEYNVKKGQEIVKQKQIEPGKAGDLILTLFLKEKLIPHNLKFQTSLCHKAGT